MKLSLFQQILLSIIITSISSTPSWAGGGDSTAILPTTSISPIENAGTQINQFNSGSFSNLTIPNCAGGCAYSTIRLAPGSSATPQNIEAVVGVTWQFNSPELAQNQVNRTIAELQKYKTEYEIIDALSIQLANAIENSQFERARIIAIVLAPKVGYPDYRLYLQKITNGKLGY
jgi:hypothetical protein